MNGPSNSFKWMSVVWALLLGIGIIVLAGAMLMPSTKRSRIDWDEVRRLQAEDEAAEVAAAATAPSGAPSTNATTQPSPL